MANRKNRLWNGSSHRPVKAYPASQLATIYMYIAAAGPTHLLISQSFMVEPTPLLPFFIHTHTLRPAIRRSVCVSAKLFVHCPSVSAAFLPMRRAASTCWAAGLRRKKKSCPGAGRAAIGMQGLLLLSVTVVERAAFKGGGDVFALALFFHASCNNCLLVFPTSWANRGWRFIFIAQFSLGTASQLKAQSVCLLFFSVLFFPLYFRSGCLKLSFFYFCRYRDSTGAESLHHFCPCDTWINFKIYGG